MVGFNPKGVQLSPSEQAFIAGTTSILSRLFIQPFDVVKIRFQVCVLNYPKEIDQKCNLFEKRYNTNQFQRNQKSPNIQAYLRQCQQ